MIFSDFAKREKILLFITIGLGLTFLIYNFLIRSLTLKFATLNKEILTNEMKLSKNLKILRKKDKVQNEYMKYSQLLKQNNSDEQEMATLLSEIESVAREIAIRISDMKPRAIKAIDFYKRLSVDIEVEAELSEITKFIYNLQNKPYLFNIDRLRFERKSRRRSSTLKGYLLVSKDLIP